MRITADRLRSIYAGVARAHGADDGEAGLFADGLLRADLRGHHTQGAGLLPYMDELFEAGAGKFGEPLTVVREAASTALLDGHGGAGHVVAMRAMDMAIDKARATGIGFVTVRRSADCGMAANYALQALDHGMIGIAMSTGPLLVAPWGGRDVQFCTNPLAIAVPAGREDPVVIDMATSASSMGKVVLAARDGKLLDTRQLVDPEGQYTNDPAKIILNAMDRESPMTGALLPEGPKGFAMLLMVEMLSALLSGERTWAEDPKGGVKTDTRARAAFYAQTLIAIDIARFQDPAEFAVSAERMVQTLSQGRPAAGFDAVRLPGAGAAARGRDYAQNGITLRDEEWAMIVAVAQKRGVPIGAA
jgi:LDH2 family malate/lactate/ureidoglycolate dehydrogenase